MTQPMNNSIHHKNDTNQNLPVTPLHVTNLHKFISFSLTTLTLFHASTVLAVTTTPKPKVRFSEAFMPLIHLLQEAAMPIGIGICIWGLIEWMMDNPKGKDRVKNAIICYVGIFLIPYIFVVIRNAFSEMTP